MTASGFRPLCVCAQKQNFLQQYGRLRANIEPIYRLNFGAQYLGEQRLWEDTGEKATECSSLQEKVGILASVN